MLSMNLSNQGRQGNQNARKEGPKRSQGPRIREDLLQAAKADAEAQNIKIGLWIDQAIELKLSQK